MVYVESDTISTWPGEGGWSRGLSISVLIQSYELLEALYLWARDNHKTFLILLLSQAAQSEARFIPLLTAEVSLRFYSSDAESTNVREVGTFSDTNSNLV
jgi:hypothetical protein